LDARTTNAARDIAELVLDREGFRDLAPRHQSAARNADGAYHWLYWWGPAKDGWTKGDGVSVNTPDWQGDGENVALARYRTFDAIAVLCAARRFPGVIADDALLDYFTRAVEEDGLEPFLIPYLRMHKRYPKLNETTVVYHLRVDSQPDWRNAVWSYRLLGQQFAERR
jgi:hypothetical protein